jgi:hypothetical protein
MGSSLVVEAEVRGQIGFRIGNAVIGLEIPLLVLDAFPEALDKDVVPPGAPSGGPSGALKVSL